MKKLIFFILTLFLSTHAMEFTGDKPIFDDKQEEVDAPFDFLVHEENSGSHKYAPESVMPEPMGIETPSDRAHASLFESRVKKRSRNFILQNQKKLALFLRNIRALPPSSKQRCTCGADLAQYFFTDSTWCFACEACFRKLLEKTIPYSYNPGKCPECGTRTTSLKQHMYTHIKFHPFICAQCFDRFSTIGRISDHLKNCKEKQFDGSTISQRHRPTTPLSELDAALLGYDTRERGEKS